MSDHRGEFDRQAAYSQLYEVMKTDRPLNDRLEDALEIGVSQFGVELGYIAETNQDTDDFEIVISTDTPDRPNLTGLREDLSNTFCMRTIQEEGLVSFTDVTDEGLEEHHAAVTYGLSCYHGAPITANGEPYGTVCFVSENPRAEPFSEAEKSFTHLVAQMAGYEIEQQEYEEQLTNWEEQLNNRSEIYRAVIDASFDLIFRLDTDGQLTYVSASATDILGYDLDELHGHSVGIALHTDEATERGSELFDQVLDGETVEEHYLPLETKAGDVVYVDVRATPIYDSKVPSVDRTPEDIVAVQGMVRDATDRKRRDGLISVINRVLRHNLRNDVGVISGYAEMLEDDLEDQQQTLARRIRTTANRLVDLSGTAQKLEQNLDVPADPEPIDLRPLADRVADELEATHPDATISVPGLDTAVVESSPRLETALWELVDNAAKHTGEAPTVEIEISETATHFKLSVRDDGPGLPELERSVLQSGEETPLVHGRGLGLWLVYWIVTGVGGTVTVTEPQHDGTTIQLRFPKR